MSDDPISLCISCILIGQVIDVDKFHLNEGKFLISGLNFIGEYSQKMCNSERTPGVSFGNVSFLVRLEIDSRRVSSVVDRKILL